MPDPVAGRAWACGYAGRGLNSPFQIGPLFDKFNDLKRLGPYHEIRAWIVDEDLREERFASWFGFEIDCGPAAGFSPTGRDMNLWTWRRT